MPETETEEKVPRKSALASSEHEKEKAKVYELGYLLVPTVTAENLGIETEKIKKVLNTIKAVHISDALPKLIDLAYEMEKIIGNKKHIFSKGYFGWIKFEMEADSVFKLKEALEQNDNVLRFMITKTARENTIASKRPDKTVYKKRTMVKQKKEPKEKIDKEEVDKKIEQLIIE